MKLKRVFTGYHAWVIGYKDEYFREIGLAPSQKIAVNNGGLDCELREYVIFEGTKRDFRAAGGTIKDEHPEDDAPVRIRKSARKSDDGFKRGRKESFRDKKTFDRERNFRDKDRRRFDDGERKPRDKKRRFDKDEAREDRAPRHFGRTDNAPGDERPHRPLKLATFGRKPGISADKEQVLNPLAGRRRKKNEE